ncbi:beta-lactamase regulatory protein [Listeria grandensis FSL F6-0971]|uniref:Beta-lactamase regulatory protein n=1 Tax=Listeria grandensis FSL F6-0971 TaxID=1265819 RepID=W7BUQ5_9LIST|nr:M56 family metallopeptidase [Listeria grandensis]EUJ24068.1 beta-lactamase regulatory protein [Listeria grandensis FSL F6-0971]
MFHMIWHTYLASIFDWVIETSILASVLVLVILCIRFVLRKWLTPQWKYALWLILVARLILPWFPESSFSIYALLPINQEPSSVTSQESTTAPESIALTPIQIEEIPVENNAYTIFLIIWIVGVLIAGLFMILTNRRLYNYISKQPVITEKRVLDIYRNCKKEMAIKKDIPLCYSGKISSPTLFGISKPRILLDEKHVKHLEDNQLRYIFYHELSHYKRKDISINLLMNCLLIVHWFNPILWYACRAMREDQEMACDNMAMTFINPTERSAYGYTIIALVEQYSTYYQPSTLAHFSKNKIRLKRRIIMIKKFNKKSQLLTAVGFIAILGVSAFSLVDVKAETTESQKQEMADKMKKEEAVKQEAADKVASGEYDEKMAADYKLKMAGENAATEEKATENLTNEEMDKREAAAYEQKKQEMAKHNAAIKATNEEINKQEAAATEQKKQEMAKENAASK